VVVSNGGGTVTSSGGILTVLGAPIITTQPINTSVDTGRAARFFVAATGAKTLTYQWRKNGINIRGATGVSYTTPPTTKADNGAVYSVRITNSFGSVTSNNATLTVN